MKSNKILIMIIVLIAILVLGAGAFTYMYLATDLMKTDSQLFAKYGEKTVEALEVFFSNESINEYYQKKILNTYENNGKLKIKGEIENDDETIKIEDEMITFEGAIDNVNKKTEQTISINYSSSEKFSFDYVRNNNLYALTSEEVVNKYVAIDSTKSILTEEEVNYTNLGNAILLGQIEKIINIFEKGKNKSLEGLSEDTKTKYLNIIKSEIEESDFSIEEGKQTGYILTISGDKLKNILINSLEQLKNESIIINLLNDEDEINEYQNNVDEYITDLQKENLQNSSVKITVYKILNGISNLKIEINTEDNKLTANISQTDGNNININLSTNVWNSGIISNNLVTTNDNISDNEDNTEVINLSLNRSVTLDKAIYTFNVSAEKENRLFTIDINGLTTDSVTESYKIESSKEDYGNISYEYINSVAFKDNIDILELNDDNSVTLNNYNSEDLNNLLQQLIEQTEKVNMEKLERAVEKVGNGEETGGTLVSILGMFIYRQASNTMVDIDLSEQKVKAYNANFENYLGEKPGATTKALIDTVKSHNLTNNDNQIYINGKNSSEDLELLKGEIKSTSSYIITADYDVEGYIERITVQHNPTIEERSSQSKTNFEISANEELQRLEEVESMMNNL